MHPQFFALNVGHIFLYESLETLNDNEHTKEQIQFPAQEGVHKEAKFDQYLLLTS